MKALTLLQPWASLMVTKRDDGRFCKMFETRSWRTDYRGLIAIHSSAGMKKAQTELALTEPFKRALAGKAYWPLPKGKVLGVGRLVDCVRTTDCVRGPDNFISHPKMVITETVFGDFTFGRWAWLIEDMVVLQTPSPAKGMLGLWEWEPSSEVQNTLTTQVLNLLAESNNA